MLLNSATLKPHLEESQESLKHACPACGHAQQQFLLQHTLFRNIFFNKIINKISEVTDVVAKMKTRRYKSSLTFVKRKVSTYNYNIYIYIYKNER